MNALSGAESQRSGGSATRRRPVGVELTEEESAALLLVAFADGGGRGTEAVEGAEEAAVGLVTPADITRPPPPGLAQAVQAPVVADPEAGVGLDVVARQLAQAGPGEQRSGPPGADGGHRVASLGRVQSGQALPRLGLEHGLGRALARERDVAHQLILLGAATGQVNSAMAAHCS